MHTRSLCDCQCLIVLRCAQFERGATNSFDIQCTDVGTLSKIRIGCVCVCVCVCVCMCGVYLSLILYYFAFLRCVSHDNSGAGAGWHLARVDVVPLEKGAPKAGRNRIETKTRFCVWTELKIFVLCFVFQVR